MIFSKLTKGYDKISKPRIADFLLQHIRIYLNIYKYLFRSFEKVILTEQWYHWMCLDMASQLMLNVFSRASGITKDSSES